MDTKDGIVDGGLSTASSCGIEESGLLDASHQNIRTYRLFAVLATAVGALTIIASWLAYVNDMLEGREFLILILVVFGLFIIVLYMLRQIAVSKRGIRLLRRESKDRYP